MALSEDQRALLQLLLEGGQSYADIGSLLGVPPDEVRKRARAALTEIAGSDPDAQVGLTDYLLGQADPIGRADAARQLESDPATRQLAELLLAQLRLLAPRARLPELRGSAAAPVAAAPAPSPISAASTAPAGGAAFGHAGGAIRRGFAKLGARENRLPVAIGAAVLLAAIVVLAVTGVIGGGNDGGSDSTSASSSDVATVPLQAQQPDSNASGQVTFAYLGGQPVMQVNLQGLAPTNGDQRYIVWLFNSPGVAFPVGQDKVGPGGILNARIPIQTALFGAIARFKAIDVSLATVAEIKAAAAKSRKRGVQIITTYVGTSILRGAIPSKQVAAVASSGATVTGATGASSATGITGP